MFVLVRYGWGSWLAYADIFQTMVIVSDESMECIR